MTGNPLSILTQRGSVTLFWDRTAEHEYELDMDQVFTVLALLSTAARVAAYSSDMSPEEFVKRTLKAQKRADKEVLRAMRQHQAEHHT